MKSNIKSIFIIFLFIFAGITTKAQTCAFEGLSRSSWNDVTNWSPASLPAAGAFITIESTCILDITPGIEFNEIKVIAASGELTIGDGQTLDVKSLYIYDRLYGGLGFVNVSVEFIVGPAVQAIADLTGTTIGGVPPTIAGGGTIIGNIGLAVLVASWAVASAFGVNGLLGYTV